MDRIFCWKFKLLGFLFDKLNVPPFLHIYSHLSKQESYQYNLQLLLPSKKKEKYIDVQFLLDETLKEGIFLFIYLNNLPDQITVKRYPTSLILLMPRQSKKERPLDGIIPNFFLNFGSNCYQLQSFCCIGLSHYVAFVQSNSSWYLFDR